MRETVPKLADSEKITINLGMVDLGRVDLLVAEGFYANRTDLIRTAIRNQLDRHQDAVERFTTRRQTELGLRHLSRADLQTSRERGERRDIRVLGLLSIADDVSPDLALATIESIQVLGAFHARAAVGNALAPRMR